MVTCFFETSLSGVWLSNHRHFGQNLSAYIEIFYTSFCNSEQLIFFLVVHLAEIA